jgi:hypothetical protein
MKNTKLAIGIISTVLFLLITLQSCATGLANALANNKDDVSGVFGFVLGLGMLTAGVVGIVTRDNKGGGITAGVIYIISSLIGYLGLGTYTDLIYWSRTAMAFGLVFIIGSVNMRPAEHAPKSE